MSLHSQEPWRVRELVKGGVQVIENGEPFAIAIVSLPSLDAGKAGSIPMEGVNHIANARRIAACVNSCAGVSTEALEKMPGSFDDLLSLEFADVVSQRDTLLTALRAIKQEIFYGIKEGAADRIDEIAATAIAAIVRGAA
jgi:hypothetical protein